MAKLKQILALLLMLAALPAALSAHVRGPIPGAFLSGANLQLSAGAHTGHSAAIWRAARPERPRQQLSPAHLISDFGTKTTSAALRSLPSQKSALPAFIWSFKLPRFTRFSPSSFLHSRLQAGWPRQWPIRPPPVFQSIL